MIKQLVYILLGLTTLTKTYLNAQVLVEINLDVNHKIDGIGTFDRNKYITCHADNTDNEYNGEQEEMLDYLINDLDVYFGRETGAMKYYSGQVAEDPNRTGFADSTEMKADGAVVNNNYKLFSDHRHAYEKGDMITAAQDVPFYPNGHTATGQGWYFSQADTPNEPFGTALGEFMGRYLRDYYGTGGETGRIKPTWVEVMNEPVWPLVDFDLHGGATIDDVFTMHSSVADQIHALSPETKVGGFTTAFPDLDKNNFAQWDERWKRFIDEVGPKMDFYSIHLYDFPGISGGLEQYRKGSNMEATMDMIEQYNEIKYGEIKPWVISEYGSQLNDWYNQPWSEYRDWLCIKAFSSMLMQFMERPNTIEKTIPFTIAKAEWGRNSPTVPYYWRLMRQQGEPTAATGEWVWSEQIKFYQLWSDVKGTRVDTKSDDLDIMVDAYVNGDKVYLILNNIDEFDHTIDLKTLGVNGNTVTGVKVKHLYLGDDNKPKLTTTTNTIAPETVVVKEEACMIIEYTYANSVTINQTSIEEKHYASTYKQVIEANQEITFTIDDISKGTYGEAVLRLGFGRDKPLSRQPVVKVNGTSVDVTTDYRGDNQQDRNNFFGVIEIDVPYEAIVLGQNTVTVTFPDAGGYVSSCAMQTFEFSREITRTENSGTTFEDEISCTTLPISVGNQESYTVEVQYSASTDRDIVVEFKDAINTWLGQGKTTVGKGTGTATVNVDILDPNNGYAPTTPGTGTGFKFVASLRPIGADWTENIETCVSAPVEVMEIALEDSVNCGNAELTTSVVDDAQTFTVMVPYLAAASRDVNVTIVSPTTGSWHGEGQTTVEAGSGIATVVVNVLQQESNGTFTATTLEPTGEYAFRVAIRPEDTDWQSNLYTCDFEDDDFDNDNVLRQNDCDDANSLIGAATTWYQDTDGDGKGDATQSVVACDKPSGYVAVAGDECVNDANKATPGDCGCGVEEGTYLDCADVPNGTATIDACGICSGGTTSITPSSPKIWYQDTDGDGKGDAAQTMEECEQPSGYVAVAGDECMNDANKTTSGDCGCGVEEGTCLDCADVPNGTASIDACGICSGGTTGITAIIDVSQCVTSVETEDIATIEVFPSPFQSYLKVKVPSTNHYTITLLNAEGKVMYSNEFVEQLTINTADLTRGVYTVRIQTNEKTLLKKIVKL